MVLLNLQKRIEQAIFQEGDHVTIDARANGQSYTGEISEINMNHARVVCSDGRTRYFNMSQLRLTHPRLECTKILSVLDQNDGLVIFNLTDEERKVQCEAKIDLILPGMEESHILENITGYTTEHPFAPIAATKKLSLTIRTAEPVSNRRMGAPISRRNSADLNARRRAAAQRGLEAAYAIREAAREIALTERRGVDLASRIELSSANRLPRSRAAPVSSHHPGGLGTNNDQSQESRDHALAVRIAMEERSQAEQAMAQARAADVRRRFFEQNQAHASPPSPRRHEASRSGGSAMERAQHPVMSVPPRERGSRARRNRPPGPGLGERRVPPVNAPGAQPGRVNNMIAHWRNHAIELRDQSRRAGRQMDEIEIRSPTPERNQNSAEFEQQEHRRRVANQHRARELRRLLDIHAARSGPRTALEVSPRDRLNFLENVTGRAVEVVEIDSGNPNDDTLDLAPVEAVDMDDPSIPMPQDFEPQVNSNPQFYNDLIGNIRERGNRVRQISNDLEIDDLPQVARDALEHELAQLRAENEQDARIIHEQEQSIRQRGVELQPSPNPAAANDNSEASFGTEVSEVSDPSNPNRNSPPVSSNNSAVDMRRSELLGSESRSDGNPQSLEQWI